MSTIEIAQPREVQPTILRAEGVVKTYRLGGEPVSVLRGVDLALAAGEMVALLGASGAGKSTLLHVLGLLDRPTEGAVYFDEKRVDRLSAARRAALRHRKIGFVFQFYHLIPELSAFENVLLGQMMFRSVFEWFGARRRAREETEQLLERVGLKDRLRHKPSQLSGGERQRVAIARALVARPQVILADEPTGNLDTMTASGVLDLLFEINREQNLAFLLVTHNEDLAARCTRVVRIRDGMVV